MIFRWPQVLYLLALFPGVAAFYIRILRRRSRLPVRYSSAVLLREAIPRYSRLRRHLPFGLIIGALAALVLAASGPEMIVTLPASAALAALALWVLQVLGLAQG